MRVTPAGSSAARAAGNEAADSSPPTTVVGAALRPDHPWSEHLRPRPSTRGRRTSCAANTPVTSTGTVVRSGFDRLEGVAGADAEGPGHLVGQCELHGTVRAGAARGRPP